MFFRISGNDIPAMSGKYPGDRFRHRVEPLRPAGIIRSLTTNGKVFYSGDITRRCGRNKQKRTRENRPPSQHGPFIDFPGYPIVLLDYECSSPRPDRLPRSCCGREHPDRLRVPVMEPVKSPFPYPRRLQWSLAVLGGAFACILILSPAAPSRADIYRWEDGQGTVHFTDDVTNIPSQYRKGSTLLIREAPSSISPTQTSPPSGGPHAPHSGSALGTAGTEKEETLSVEQEKEELVSRVEHQKAKIAAKEQHIRAVDAKRSLAINPLRNRIVDPADMELYTKYKEELPGDKKQLKELESLLESIK